jgi:hypothetical protein
MNPKTPKTLRALADRYPDGPSHATFDAHADAWEADIIAWCDTTVERDALRQRLEATEALVLQYDGQAEKHLAEIAALAAGESEQ